MNDEKTTEIEIPPPLATNIVRVNFTERRKIQRPAAQAFFRTPASPAAMAKETARFAEPQGEWATPWWVRLAVLGAILVLSLFVL
jgi:hypothetical protein